MTSLYVETSALLKRYVQESESIQCQSILNEHSRWITSRITITETLVNLSIQFTLHQLSGLRANASYS